MKNKIVIFGAAGGIGSAVYNMLHKDKFSNVLRVDLGLKIGKNKSDFVVDATEHREVAEFFKNNLDTAIVINCVGVNRPEKIKEGFHYWEYVYKSNVKVLANILSSSYNTKTRLYINICSNSGIIPRTSSSSYCSSKAAVRMLVRSAARELAPEHKTVIGIDPGYIEGTNMSKKVETSLKGSKEEFRKSMLSRIPIRRFVTAKEVADLVSYLCKHKSPDCFTGTNIEIAGGEI